MITVRRAEERRHERRGGHEVWLTFAPHHKNGAHVDGFGALELFNEVQLPPGARLPRSLNHDAEIVSYVRVGTLAYEDTLGRSGVLYAGEFQRRNVRRGMGYSERNASQTDPAQVFQIWLHAATAGLEPRQARRRFSMADRRGQMCVVASGDARRGSLLIRQDAVVISAILAPGQHVVHELTPGRSSWLHIVQGEVSLDDIVLTTGDGVGMSSERSVSFTAREQTEIVLVDLGEHRPDDPKVEE